MAHLQNFCYKKKVILGFEIPFNIFFALQFDHGQEESTNCLLKIIY